jgi:hypothetical protein
MLKVNSRISQENAGRGVTDKPPHRGVRQRIPTDDRLIARQFGPERTVEAQQRPRRETFLPKGMTVFQTGKIEFGTAIVPAKRMQDAPVKPGARRRQERARWKCGRHAR